MQTNLEKIKNIIQSSQLSDSDKKELLDVFEKVKDSDLIEIAELLENDPVFVSQLSKNLKAKRIALELKNSDMWQKILETEEFELNELNQ